MLTDEFSIGDRAIRRGGPPYVIAEAGSNFNQSLSTAMDLIDAAADAGADAVKFQLFKAEALYPEGTDLYRIFKSIELPRDWVPRLIEHAAKRSIAWLASSFDLESLRYLEEAGVPAHKIASSEVTNLRLLAAVARTGKPIFMATGMCDLSDIQVALQILKAEGNPRVSLMQCGTVYPLPIEDVNLKVIPVFAATFGGPVGFSDHTLGRDAAVAAAALGAVTFEKHFTLDRTSDGPDHFYALEPGELAEYIESIRKTHRALGSGQKEMLPQERAQGRREGLYARIDLSPGAVLRPADVEAKRPALGIRAEHLPRTAGAIVRRGLAAGDPINWQDLDFAGEHA